jgi:CysZ protein
MVFISDFLRGLKGHGNGIRFAFAHKAYLPLVFFPFILTLLLFTAAFFAFSAYSEAILGYFWQADPETATGIMAALAWVWLHVVKYLLYLVLFALMYFLFMVVANVIASPIYDHVAGKLYPGATGISDSPGAVGERPGVLGIVVEELKKACFILIIPVALLFIPVAGQILSPLAAMIFLAWDFVDFSLSRDRPDFRGRLRYVRKRKLFLLGFGAPLLIPVLNILLFPFAILGATLAYRDDPLREKIIGRTP